MKSGDIERLLAVLDTSLIDYSDGRRSGYGEDGKRALRSYLQDLFANYNTRLVPIIIEIKVMGEVAVEYGWLELALTGADGMIFVQCPREAVHPTLNRINSRMLLRLDHRIRWTPIKFHRRSTFFRLGPPLGEATPDPPVSP
jgi:hypothetical protein